MVSKEVRERHKKQEKGGGNSLISHRWLDDHKEVRL